VAPAGEAGGLDLVEKVLTAPVGEVAASAGVEGEEVPLFFMRCFSTLEVTSLDSEAGCGTISSL
jgi:hypothetical protein